MDFIVPKIPLNQIAFSISLNKFIQPASAFIRREESLPSTDVTVSSYSRHMEALARSVCLGWPVLLVGPPNSGKSSLVKTLAQLTRNSLHQTVLSEFSDVGDLIGSYEQVDASTEISSILKSALDKLDVDQIAQKEISAQRFSHVCSFFPLIRLLCEHAEGLSKEHYKEKATRIL